MTDGDEVHRGRVLNLSTGGILVATEPTLPGALLGRTVDVELRLDGKSAEWLQVTGTVRRLDAAAVAIELAFVPASFVQFVDDNLTASHRHLRVLSAVLVDEMPDRRSAISEAFRAIGCTVLDVSTALEAIVRLGESQFEPDLVIIADSVPSSTSDELRWFVEREHPRTTLVTVGDDLIGPSGLAHWLSSADPNGDLVARIRDLLSHSTSHPR